MSLRIILLISILLISCQEAVIASADFQQLRANLQSRQGEPKIFLPDRVIVGQPTDIVVMAPGAYEVTLYGNVSKPDFVEEGPVEPENDLTAINGTEAGPKQVQEKPSKDLFGKKLLGKKQLAVGQNRATFKVAFDDHGYSNQLCSFEALVSYREDESEDEMFRAVAFGSNATYRGSYLVRIIDTPRAKTNPLDSINALIPGLGGKSLDFRNQYQN